VRQFTAQQVKLAVTGYGAASKNQVQGWSRVSAGSWRSQAGGRRGRPRARHHVLHDGAHGAALPRDESGVIGWLGATCCTVR